jgi:glutamate N-acetyltransferase / amino-acid N-acetyltransferase
LEFHEVPKLPRGFRCASRNCGIKPAGKDLSIFVSDVDAAAAAIFTLNRFPGAPVLLGRETIRSGVLRAIVVNSRVSNVATGDEGLVNAGRMAAAAAAELGTTPGRVLVSSTGVIGVPLPIDRIEAGLRGMADDLEADPLVGAEGIMTTDSHPKALSLSVGAATVTIIAKGSGMIEPNMATMLAYIFTDAAVDATSLDGMLRAAADVSFNMLSVDTDTSTSDTCVIMANGLAGAVDAGALMDALQFACVRMTEILARDGEGATKLLRASVRGAHTVAEARRVAKTLINSPLIKTMAYGADPNVGRILMAVGKCLDATYESGRVGASINGFVVVEDGQRARFVDDTVRAQLAGEVVDLEIDLAAGDAEATAYGCDLTEGYVRENASYYSS